MSDARERKIARIEPRRSLSSRDVIIAARAHAHARSAEEARIYRVRRPFGSMNPVARLLPLQPVAPNDAP